MIWIDFVELYEYMARLFGRSPPLCRLPGSAAALNAPHLRGRGPSQWMDGKLGQSWGEGSSGINADVLS